MERGTPAERDAVRERWAALERRRRRTTRLLVGWTLGGAGLLLWLAAAVTEACAGGSGYPWSCRVVTPVPSAAGLVVVGAVLGIAGVWFLVDATGG